MTRVVIDTSSLIAAGVSLSSPIFQSLATAATRAGLEICLPRVVLEETVNHFQEQLQELVASFLQSSRRIHDLTAASFSPQISQQFVEQELVAYRQRLTEWLESAGGRIVDYPAVSHDVLATLEMRKVKPFDPKRSGYRDSLIWFTIIDLLEQNKEEVIFVCNNIRDFGAPGLNRFEILHDDLKALLIERGMESDLVRCMTTLNDVSTGYIKPILEELDEFARQLLEGEFPWLNVAEFIGQMFDNWMQDLPVDIQPEAVGFFEGVNWVEFVGSTGYLQIQDIAARRLADALVLIDVQVIVECEFEFEADSRSDLAWSLDFGSGTSARGTRAREVSAGLQLTANLDTRQVESSRLTRLGEDGRYTSVELTFSGLDVERISEIFTSELRNAQVHSYCAMRFD